MKPQAGAFLERARELLDQADTVMSVDLNEVAGRTAITTARRFVTFIATLIPPDEQTLHASDTAKPTDV